MDFFFFNLHSKNLRLEKVSPRPPLFLSDPAPFSTLPRPLQLRRGSLHELQADQRRDGVPQHGEGAAGGKKQQNRRTPSRDGSILRRLFSHSSCRFLQNSIFTAAAAAAALESICFFTPTADPFFFFHNTAEPPKQRSEVRGEAH